MSVRTDPVEGSPTKRPTIADIAERAGVSVAAVSYALNGRPGVSLETRERILEAADEMGWRPNIAARSLIVSRAQAIGLVIARSASTLGVEPFYMRFIAGLEAELSARKSALLLQVAQDHAAAIRTIRLWWAERRIDGVIITDLWHEDDRVPMLERLGIPSVLVGRPQPGSGLPAVWSDDAAAVGAAVHHLVVERGHRRIARVAGLPALDHSRLRTAAFTETTRRLGLPPAVVVDTDYSWEAGARATRELLSRADRPTAIMYDNDVMAVAALNVAREMGISVPGELALLAGDDSPLCQLVHPSLTALTRDISQFASHAARTLLDSVEGRSPSSYQDTTAQLTRRESTSAGPPADPSPAE